MENKCTKHKYLKDSNIQNPYPTTSDIHRFSKEIEIFGFSSKETWSLDCSFFVWIYERFMMFNDSVCLFDTTTPRIILDDKEYTMQEVLDEIIETSKWICLYMNRKYFEQNEHEELNKKESRLFHLLQKTIHYWWW